MIRYFLLITLILTALGCSGGGSGGVTSPDPLQDTNRATNSAPTPYVWGIWTVEYDIASGNLTAEPFRTAEGIWNVNMFLQPPAGSLDNLGIAILDKTNFLTEGRMDLRVTLHHPFPSPKLRGFDIRGVVYGDAATVDSYNSDIIYPAINELRLLNADGYTRWMNAPEFAVPGILGFDPGVLGTKDFSPTATINGYKYFAEIMEPEQSVYEYFSDSLAYVANRGSLTPGLQVSRDYHLKFPTSPLIVKFQYAILAGWEKATSGGGNPSPLDFPDNANTFEPIGLSVVDNSSVYMESETKKGGDINLQLNIVDWWAYWDAPNLSDHISKIIVSSDNVGLAVSPPTTYIEFDFSTLVQYGTSAGNAEAVDILIPNVIPSGVDDQELLIAIEMSGYDYSNPFGVPNDAGDDPLTAYFIHTLTVSPEFNDPPVISSGITGDASVFTTDLASYSVVAVDDDSPVLTYEWTIKDPLTDMLFFGPDPGNADGNIDLDWGAVNTPGTVVIYCSVSDGENIVDADPLEVYVNDVIFHANLDDTITGDNAGWSEVEEQGTSHWTDIVGQDSVLQGHGYKFSPFNTLYTIDSAGILLTPQVPIPATIDRAIAVIFHSYEWEYYAPLEVGFDGGNFKISQAPATPVYTDTEIDIIGGKDYEGWLFDTAITSQMVFYSNVLTDEIQVSAIEVPAEMIGENIYLGFACATDATTYGDNHGWMIDDVQIRALPISANAPPIAGSPVTGDAILPMISEFPGHFEVLAYDLEDDPLTYAWTVREPGTGTILWGPELVADDNFIDIDMTQVGITGELEVHVAIYDDYHPGAAAVPLTIIVQDVIFHADFSDTTSGDNAGWTETNQSGTTTWTSTVGSDGFLNGSGYKWGDFSASYTENSAGILQSPSIMVPPGIAGVSVYIRHDFEFLATLDGGNFKVTKAPTIPAFATPEADIDGGFDYDVEMNGTALDGQDAFGIGQLNDNGLISRMDFGSFMFDSNMYVGIAAASGTTMFNMRGWLIDDIVVAVNY